MRKIDKEFIEKAEKLMVGLNASDRNIVQSLLNNYKENNFLEWNERHEKYRDIVERMVNDTGFEDDKLAEHMANNHPTLQQNFMRMCIKFIRKMAEKKYCDGRNEASVNLAKRIVEAIDGNDALPFV